MAMEYETYLDKVINDGIAAARVDYAERPAMLKGAVAGFEACRGLQPSALAALLKDRNQQTRAAFRDESLSRDQYWETRCFEAEVEWVCNCVSAVLMNQNLPMIVNPTARGMMKAAAVVGVRAE